jgi:hypothetical protein
VAAAAETLDEERAGNGEATHGLRRNFTANAAGKEAEIDRTRI